jgi:phenylpropionate dioxygenase-like ring-hydroxylating dioxygenase large terminal subunit
VREPFGTTQDHTCIYHHWCYDLAGNLIGVPFERGIRGKGGMPETFDKRNHGLQTLNVATYRGVIFGSFSHEVESLESFLDKPNMEYLDTMFNRPIEILGHWRQRIPGNWKFYFENLMDSYHAGLLHQFQTTFGIMRTTQRGGSKMDRLKRHRVLFTVYDSDDLEASDEQLLKNLGVYDDTLSLADPSMIEFRDEVGDGCAIMMMALFPSVIFQRLSNTLATRQIRPRGPNEFELNWTCFAYADDDESLRKLRLKQVNMIGPAGYVSIEDGEAGALIQRVIGRERDRYSVIEMGGLGPIEDPDSPLTEVPVRGFWRYYCHLMGYQAEGAPAWVPGEA